MSGIDFQWPVTFSSTTMTGTSVCTGSPMNIFGCSRVTFQVTWTGAAVGTFTFQTTSYPGDIFNADGTVNSAVKWTTLTNPSGFTALQPNNTPGTYDFGFADLSQKWIRPIYTNTSSTGTLGSCYGSARH